MDMSFVFKYISCHVVHHDRDLFPLPFISPVFGSPFLWSERVEGYMTFMRIRFFLVFFSLLLAVSGVKTAFPTSPQLSGPHFTDIIVTTSETHLLLFGELRNSMNDDMVEGLHSGIPIRFSFFVELEKSRSNWFNEELASLSFSHTLIYDTLKESYVVQTEESARYRSTVPSLPEARDLLNEINGVKIVELDRLVPETKYRMRIKADLHKKTLPLSLHTIIPFISWWNLKTDWYTVEFIY